MSDDPKASQAAQRMRNLSDECRDASIAASGPEVVDARSRFEERARRAQVAAGYRSPK